MRNCRTAVFVFADQDIVHLCHLSRVLLAGFGDYTGRLCCFADCIRDRLIIDRGYSPVVSRPHDDLRRATIPAADGQKRIFRVPRVGDDAARHIVDLKRVERVF